MVKISVILPIYNVEDYLEETLTSLLNQTIIDDIEVLMIDDGSSDDSRYIIEKYALDYDNFHAFHKPNEGQGIARNFALNMAKGDYIHFFDSDDYIIPDAYETLYDLALKNNSDIIIGNVLRFGSYNIWSDSLFKHSFDGLQKDMELTSLNQRYSLLWDTSTSNKLYKKEFLDNNEILFPNKKIFFEDLILSMESYIKANSIYISNKVFYYWRFRGKKTSVTQQHDDIKNFYDRLEILNMQDKLMKNNNLSKDLINYEYEKWLNHDLKIFLKKIINYPSNLHYELIDEINNNLKIIPCDLFNQLNSYKQILYQMVKNKDINGILSFANLEKDLNSNYNLFDCIDNKYLKYADFEKDGLSEELIARILNVETMDDCLKIEFSEKIMFIEPDYPHETFVTLTDEDNVEIFLEVENNKIFLPINLIKDNKYFKLKITYKSEEFTKHTYLKNNKRQSFCFDSLDVDFNMGLDNVLYINRINKNNHFLEITDVNFDGNDFKFKCKSDVDLNEVFVRNIATLNTVNYSLQIDNDELILKIPYSDILNEPIKKWELNCRNCLNSIYLNNEFNFYHGYNHIKIFNNRNKVLIENNLVNTIAILEDKFLKIENIKLNNSTLRKNNKLYKNKNKKINKSNKKLNNKIKEFKARKDVQIVDKIKNFK